MHMQVLQKGEHFVFEFRHPSWFTEEVYAVLRENDWCIAAVHLCQGTVGTEGAIGEGRVLTRSLEATRPQAREVGQKALRTPEGGAASPEIA
jgi:uncharacterized protein YecE (DUF72 family)